MVVIVMGVSGAGKTTVGLALAKRLGFAFYEGDAFHPKENVAKMAAGTPLTDADRAPWLERIAALIRELNARGENGVIACSALKESYRALLGIGQPGVRLVFIDAPAELLAERLANRSGHFFPPSLLKSQLETLEPPKGAIVLDAHKPVAVLVDEAAAALAG